ncbi:WhiB family transcriptional regulator [Streptomyces mirabilis]|uniref:WhiB family transcriptional regulator n=1 Tax=Streptomyces mirabilis TaxID=68239 RepID=UPI0033245CC0
MSRTGIRSAPEADPRIPFPFTDTQTACQIRPEWFSHEQTSTRAAEKDIAKAKAACPGCPIVKGCLKWALAHPDLTQVGVWAATTTRQRGQLRRRLKSRLGPDWVGVLAQREQAARRRTRPPRDTATITRETPFARPELELIPTRLTPHEPGREPHTPQRQAHNPRHLEPGLAQRPA